MTKTPWEQIEPYMGPRTTRLTTYRLRRLDTMTIVLWTLAITMLVEFGALVGLLFLVEG